ncbi:MAG: PepSY-associated TM helix domain-containing protein [Bacteroidetes bacterium]|nr:PepSY-associated TM helix domain-containing protein [Bacteroidota bacterium]
MNWRKWVKIIHRDLGYICAGLTIIYAVSGVAVNHVNDWNPNYIITKDTLIVSEITDRVLSQQQVSSLLIEKLAVTDSLRSSFRPNENEIELFFKNKTIKAKLASGVVIYEKVNSRRVFRESNFLHLNNPKKLWTYVADLFAVSLILLAITGLFMIKGKNGITGRGKWLTALGIIIPIIFLFMYY